MSQTQTAQINQLAIDAANGDKQAAHMLEQVCKAEAMTDNYNRTSWKDRLADYMDAAYRRVQVQ